MPPKFLDKFSPDASRRARVRKRLTDRLEKFALRNDENLRWTILQSLKRVFRQFGYHLDVWLDEAITATHGAIQGRRSRRQERADTVAAQLERVEACAAPRNEIQSRLLE